MGPSDGVCSVVRAPGSAAAVVRAVETAPTLEYHEGAPEAIFGSLHVLAMALLCNLYADGSPPGTDEALADWRAAARGAGAVPALRVFLESPLHGAPGIRVLAASAAAVVELLGRRRDDLAAAGDAPRHVRRGAADPSDVMLQYDSVVEPATEALLAGLEGAPARSGKALAHSRTGPAHQGEGPGRACQPVGRPRRSAVGPRRGGRERSHSRSPRSPATRPARAHRARRARL
jgi:hypothetical protein